MPEPNISSAILLCAGRGTRLRPHTDKTPKPLLPVDGVPTLEHSLRSLHFAGIENLLLIMHHLSEQIESFMLTRKGPAFKQWQCVFQKEMGGTADAALTGMDARPEWFGDTFIVAATDYILWPDFYPALCQYHREHGDDITVSLKAIPEDELSSRSSVRFDQEQRIVEVVEKPKPGTAPSPLSANLVYILPAPIAGYIKVVKPSVRGEKEIQTAINAYLAQGGTARGLVQDTPLEWQPGQL